MYEVAGTLGDSKDLNAVVDQDETNDVDDAANLKWVQASHPR